MPEIIMAFAPLAFLIIYALKTRRMAESMVLATLLAVGGIPEGGAAEAGLSAGAGGRPGL